MAYYLLKNSLYYVLGCLEWNTGMIHIAQILMIATILLREDLSLSFHVPTM